MNSRVQTAMRVVAHAHYCLDDQGNPIPQTSSIEMISRMLQQLSVQPGDSVLEVGTGSGYSTALLAELTGPNGSIVSIDVDPEMTRRATVLLNDAGYRQVILITGDGREGALAHAPFDRLVAWAAASEMAQAWCDQTRPGGLLVVPMRINNTPWVSTYLRTARGDLVEQERLSGSFIPLTAQPFRPWETAQP